MAELNWTEAQWQRVNEAVADSFSKASVAGAFLPMYGPLTGSAEVVRNERLQQSEENSTLTIRLDRDFSSVNLRLATLTVNVELSGEQVADESLSNALLAFRRAANVLAQSQDKIVFSGFRRGFADEDSKAVRNAEPQKGLADLPARIKFDIIQPEDGQTIVANVVKAVGDLEKNSNPGPFACVLSDRLFDLVHTPSSSLVLPADRILPLLKGGALLRSGQIRNRCGIVVSLAGNSIDIVVGTPPTAQFLQRETSAKFVFRVYERFVLRIRDKETMPVVGFRLSAEQGEADQLFALAIKEVEDPLAKVLTRFESASEDVRVQILGLLQAAAHNLDQELKKGA